MATLKRYTTIDKLTWDLIDEMQSIAKEDNFKARLKVPETPIDILYFYIQKGSSTIKRAYCRCGEAYNVKAAAYETPDCTCPSCGKKNFISITKGYSRQSLGDLRTLEVVGNTVHLKRVSYILTEDTTRDVLVLNKEHATDAIISDSNINIMCPSSSTLNEYKFNDFLDIKPFDLPGFEHFSIPRVSNITFSNIDKYFKAKKDYPTLMNEIEAYPKLVSAAVSFNPPELNAKSTVDDIFRDIIKCPTEYIPLVNKMISQMPTGDIVGGYYYSSCKITERMNYFEHFDCIQTPELKQSLDYILRHANFPLKNFKDVLSSIETLKLDKNLEVVLAKYILANHVTEGYGVVNCFSSKLSFLKANGYPVSEDNFDKRNYNLLRQMKAFSEYGFSQERTSLFFDAFDLNPLEAIKYLDAKRAPSKALRSEIEAKMDKKYS